MGFWQRVGLVCVTATAVTVGGRALRVAMASDEQQVRWVFEKLQRGFDNTRLGPVIRGFDENYMDESSGMTREDLRSTLIYLFLNEKDPETRRFSLRMELDSDALQVEVADGTYARVHGSARFFELRGGVERVFWDARFLAELVDSATGWHIVHTSGVNVADLEDLD
ncbi:MAG: hypothetical protein ACI8QZ_001289 [Chlamydiales bacterium]|jgi:hypothetical protein